MAKTADPVRSEGENETTPLLGAAARGVSPVRKPPPPPSHETVYPSGDQNLADDAQTPSQRGEEEEPFARKQVLLLCFAAIAEPVAYFAIFPIISEMIQRTESLKKEDVGFWTGLIESLFSLVQMTLMVLYGRAADKIGRKPVLVFSLFGIAGATALFGMSQAIWQMIVFRCLCGSFAGSVVTLRTMISENTTKRTQGTAFSWFAFSRNLGILVGPLIGGGLANPAEEFPNVFGNSAFLKKYPYALSTYAAGGVVLVAAVVSLFFVNETLRRKDEDPSNPEPPLSTWQIVTSPGVGTVIFIYGYVSMLGLFYTAISPVFMYTPSRLGGYGFSDQQIAYFLAIAGASQAAWLLLVFPPLQRRFGTGNVMRACAVGWAVFSCSYPLMNELRRHGLETMFWVLAPTLVALGSGVAMGFTCGQLFLNDMAPSPAVLGTLNALALTVTSGIRAFIPVLATSVYAFGIKGRWGDGHLAWLILLLLSVVLIVAMAYLPAAAEGKTEKPSSTGDEQ